MLRLVESFKPRLRDLQSGLHAKCDNCGSGYVTAGRRMSREEHGLDLLPYVPFSVEQARENARRVHPGIEIIEISCMTGEGLDRWLDWLRSNRTRNFAMSSA